MKQQQNNLKRVIFSILCLALALSQGLGNLTLAQAEPPLTAFAGENLLSNYSFETYTTRADGSIVATDWTPFVLSDSPSGGLKFRRGTDISTNPERIEGAESQLLRSDGTFDAGIYQTVSGLTTDKYYSVLVYVLSIFETSAVSNPRVFDGLIVKQIGVDPLGGINPNANSIIWGFTSDKNMDASTWGQRMTFKAQGSKATLFIRVHCLRAVDAGMESTYENQVYIDFAHIRLSPVPSVNVPTTVQNGSFTVSWDASVPNAGSATAQVVSFDVQYRDGGGVWQDWLKETTSRSATFNRQQPGHTYAFRVRGWARYYVYSGRYAEIFGPWSDASADVRIGRVVELTVQDNSGIPILGVPASMLKSGSVVASGVSDSAGHVYLSPSTDGQYDISTNPSYFLAPPILYNVTVGSGVQPVTMTMLPPDELISDGSFEAAVPGSIGSGWALLYGRASVTNYRSHCGHQSLDLNVSPEAPTSCFEQAFTLSQVYRPMLSFWYRLEPSQNGMIKVLKARLLDQTNTVLQSSIPLQSQQDSGWLHLSLPLPTDDTPYSGTVTVRLCLEDGASASYETTHAYLDDISFGRSSGGPYKTRLPFIAR